MKNTVLSLFLILPFLILSSPAETGKKQGVPQVTKQKIVKKPQENKKVLKLMKSPLEAPKATSFKKPKGKIINQFLRPMCSCGNHAVEDERDIGRGDSQPRCSPTYCNSFSPPHEGCIPPSEWVGINYQYPEECDDGNEISGDGCSSTCRDECRASLESLVREGYRVREYIDSRHISRCVDDHRVRYLICSLDGAILTVNEDECSRCENGVCIIQGVTCTEDTDLANDPRVRGVIRGLQADGITAYEEADYCTTLTMVAERYCEGGLPRQRPISCQPSEYCSNGACVSGVGLRCNDTDPTRDPIRPGGDPYFRGTVSGAYPDGTTYEFQDWCAGGFVAQRDCTAGGLPDMGSAYCCPPGETCQEGVCAPGGALATCFDTDGGEDANSRGRVVGRYRGGEPFEVTDGCSNDRVMEFSCQNLSDRPNGGCASYEVNIIECGPDRHCVMVDGLGGACAGNCGRCSPLAATATAAAGIIGTDCVIQHDICRNNNPDTPSDDELIRYECGPDGMPATRPPVPCPAGCNNGVCCPASDCP